MPGAALSLAGLAALQQLSAAACNPPPPTRVFVRRLESGARVEGVATWCGQPVVGENVEQLLGTDRRRPAAAAL